VRSGTIANISIAPRRRDDGFGMLFEGSITITKPGKYYFETSSDDGSKFYIGNYGHYNTPVVDNDGLHDTGTKGGWYTFKEAGNYDFAVSYFEKTGIQELSVYWGSDDAGIAMHTPIPDNVLGPPASAASSLTYAYYEGTWDELPDFEQLAPLETGHAITVDFLHKRRDNNYAFLWKGKINILDAGWYEFSLTAANGGELYIDDSTYPGKPLIKSDGNYKFKNYRFPAPGSYDFALAFFVKDGPPALTVMWERFVGYGYGFDYSYISKDWFAVIDSLKTCVNVPLVASEGDSYRWSTGETTRSIVAGPPGNYSVTVTKGVCAGTASLVVHCFDDGTISGGSASLPANGEPSIKTTTARIATPFSIEKIPGQLYLIAAPNPSATQFNIRIDGITPGANALLIVSDALGRIVERRTIAANGQLTLGEQYHPGLYHLQLVQGRQRKAVKIIKTGR
jgi:hypothetical protein